MNPYEMQLARWSKLIIEGHHYYARVEASGHSSIFAHFMSGDHSWTEEWDVLAIRLPKDGELPEGCEEDLVITWHGVHNEPITAGSNKYNRVLRVLNEPL